MVDDSLDDQSPESRPLPEQFSALPVGIQSRMFRVLDLIIGMDQEEKAQAREDLDAGRVVFAEQGKRSTAALLASVDYLVWAAQREADPNPHPKEQ